MPDDTILIVERHGDGPPILLLPAVGESVSHVRGVAEILSHNTVYAVELRGHGLSEGVWSAAMQSRDVEHLLTLLKEPVVIAFGLSATLLLENHRPHGMILINPLADGKTLRPGHCRVPFSRAHLFALEKEFDISSVTVQAPTVIFTHEPQRWMKIAPHAHVRFWPELRIEQLHQLQEALHLFKETSHRSRMIPRPTRHPAVRNGIAG